MTNYNIHFITGTGDIKEELVPEQDYYETHTIESLYLLLSDLVKPEDGFKNLTLDILRDLIEKQNYRCVVMIKDATEDFHHVFFIPEPKRIRTH